MAQRDNSVQHARKPETGEEKFCFFFFLIKKLCATHTGGTWRGERGETSLAA